MCRFRQHFWQLIVVLFAAFIFSSTAFAKPTFPALTGRVLDNARILSTASINNLEQILSQYETTTSNQLVVVTIPSLQGLTIEEYGYQLGRAWGIGQKEKNNGVLLIVAPKDRQVRIEVGYGLEGKLTDAVSSQIIQTIILPKFRNKDYAGGISDGVTAIVTIIENKPITGNITIHPSQEKLQIPNQANFDNIFAIILFFVMLVIIIIALRANAARGGNALEIIINILMFFLGGGGRGGKGGGGFSGKGGGFGGGGSSGKW